MTQDQFVIVTRDKDGKIQTESIDNLQEACARQHSILTGLSKSTSMLMTLSFTASIYLTLKKKAVYRVADSEKEVFLFLIPARTD